MPIYILKRLTYSLLVLYCVATVTFIIAHAIPGGPFDRDKELPPAIAKNIEEKYQLEQPLFKQYFNYLGNLLVLDLGPSLKYKGKTVNNLIWEYFPISAILGLTTLIFSLVVGVALGTIAALKKDGWQDIIIMVMVALGAAVPTFALGPILLYIFALKLKCLPAAMWGTPQQMVLPVLTLAAFPVAYITRLTKVQMINIMREDYIIMAYARGLSTREVVFYHALRNTLPPILSYLGPLAAGLLTGSFIVEKIFAIPGLGQYYITSIGNRDYTMILGVTIFYTVLLVFFNFIVDLSYLLLNPKVKLEKDF